MTTADGGAAQAVALIPDSVCITPTRLRSALLWLFVLGPAAGCALAISLAATVGLGPSWLDIGLSIAAFLVAGHGVTVGFHRHFTHRSFRARRGLKIALALAGCLALEGTVTDWVATHRLHHARSDQVGDPHSPWRYGSGPWALTKGLIWAQVGWLFGNVTVSTHKYAPDLLADRDVRRIDRAYPLWIVISVLGPAAVGGLVTQSFTGALTAFLWAGLARVLLLHHVTWAVNSLCHVVGQRPFQTRDRATNVRALAVLSMGESWHNLHHADPTCARHGVDPGQLDSSAALIRAFERLGWASHVRWPDPARLSARRADAQLVGPSAGEHATLIRGARAPRVPARHSRHVLHDHRPPHPPLTNTRSKKRPTEAAGPTPPTSAPETPRGAAGTESEGLLLGNAVAPALEPNSAR